MKTENTNVYFCEYCKKYSIHKNVMSRHEKRCSRNPVNNHACFSCVHLKKEVRTETHEDGPDYPHGLRFTDFTCLKKDIQMRTYKTEYSSRLNAYYGNLELMPNECNLKEFFDEDFGEINDLFDTL